MPATVDSIIESIPSFSGRLFGIEIECIGLNTLQAADLLNANNVPSRDESYNHSRRGHWKITTDSSINGEGRETCEVVSPPLAFTAENLRLVAKVVNLLKDAGCTVNTSCGLHVHVDSRDVRNFPTFARILFLRYREAEEEIDRMMDITRRANNNRFCRTLKNLNRNASFDSINADRYQKLNFQSFQRHGTVEFRQHHGTMDAVRIISWLIFCVDFWQQTHAYFMQQGHTEIVNASRWA